MPNDSAHFFNTTSAEIPNMKISPSAREEDFVATGGQEEGCCDGGRFEMKAGEEWIWIGWWRG